MAVLYSLAIIIVLVYYN